MSPTPLVIAGFYKEWFGYGEGLGNFMAYGDLPPPQVPSTIQPIISFPAAFSSVAISPPCILSIPAKVAEYVTHSWYEYSVGDQTSRHPAERRDQAEVLRSEAALSRSSTPMPNTPGSNRRATTTSRWKWARSPAR